MKTLEQVNLAREALRNRVQEPGLNREQLALLCGMLNALVWVADGPDATTIQRVLDGEALSVRKKQ